MTEGEFLERLEGFGARRVPPEQLEHVRFDVGAVPLSGLTATDLNSELFGGASNYIPVAAVLMLLGGLILAVACINYANLATARAAGRGRDIGLRKVVGASRGQIMLQYFFEVALLVTSAAAAAIICLALVAPVLDSNVGINVTPIVLSTASFWIFILLTLAAVTLAAGAYPAFVLSRLRPVETLRVGQRRSGPRFVATLLVGTQFVAASFLLIAVMVVSAQNSELRRSALGVTTDPLLVIDNASPLTGVSTEALLDELQRLPQVRAVTATAMTPWSGFVNLGTMTRSPDNARIDTARVAFFNHVGPGFFSVFDMPLLAGRVFDREHGEDLLPDFQDWSVDRPLNENYNTFSRVNQVFVILAIAAFFISLVGLFGMAIQVANRRIHEIGVRKTLGATTGQIVSMLIRDFSRPVVIANLIAWPLAYVAARFYLNVFMHRIPLTPWPFVVSLLITVCIAWIAVGGQAYRAARVQPASVLRAE